MNPKNLNEYYQSLGQSLPSVAQRQGVAAQAGIQDYRGTAAQNAQLLTYLQGNNQTPAQTPAQTPSAGTVGNAINLGNVNTNLTVPNIPTNAPVQTSTQTRTFTPTQFTEQGLLDQRGNLERELFDIEGTLTNQNARRNELLQQAGIDMNRVNTINQQLQAAQDREIEIPIEARQDLRGRGATVTEFQQRTTPQLENAALNALALSRQSQALGNQIAQIDQQLETERQNNTLMYQQKTQRLNQIEQLYGSILSDKQKVQIEAAKYQNELDLYSAKAEIDMRSDILKNFAGTGADINMLSRMTTQDLYSLNIGGGIDYVNMSLDQAQNLNKDQFAQWQKIQETKNTLGEQASEKETKLFQQANSATRASELVDRILGNTLGIKSNVGTSFLGRSLFGTPGTAGSTVLGALTGDNQSFINDASQLYRLMATDEVGRATKLGNWGVLSDADIALISGGADSLGAKIKNGSPTGKFDITESRFKEVAETYAKTKMQEYIFERIGLQAYQNAGWQNKSLDAIKAQYNTLLNTPIGGTSNQQQSASNQFFGFNQVGNDTNTSVSLIKQFEGFSPTAYRDGNGYSIGYGNQTHPDGTTVKAGDKINQSQADQYLASAINSHSNWKNLIQVPLNANQQAALASFEYNLGSGIWNSGNSARGIIQAINNGNFQQAANLMQQFNKSQGNTLSALVNRRRQEGQLLVT